MWSPSILSNGKTVKTLVKILLLELRNGTKLHILPNLSCPLFSLASCQSKSRTVLPSPSPQLTPLNLNAVTSCELLQIPHFHRIIYPPVPIMAHHCWLRAVLAMWSLTISLCILLVWLRPLHHHSAAGITVDGSHKLAPHFYDPYQNIARRHGGLSSPPCQPTRKFTMASLMRAEFFFFWSFKVWLFGWIRCSQT